MKAIPLKLVLVVTVPGKPGAYHYLGSVFPVEPYEQTPETLREHLEHHLLDEVPDELYAWLQGQLEVPRD